MVKKNKGFGIYIAFGVWGFFFIGFVYSPKGKGNTPKEMSSVIKIETLYVKNEIIPTTVKVDSVVKSNSKKNKSEVVESNAINKEGYRGRSYGYDIRHYNREELKKYLDSRYLFKNDFRITKTNLYLFLPSIVQLFAILGGFVYYNIQTIIGLISPTISGRTRLSWSSYFLAN